MFSPISTLDLARKILCKHAEQVSNLSKNLDDHFEKVVDLIYRSKGRLVVTGIGKSALIASKIVATLNSTGTPALFMHSADAIHGDLGMIKSGEDMVLCLSNSGNTPEIKKLIFFLKNFDVPIFSICGDEASYLATKSDYVLCAKVDMESIHGNFAPTSSTMAQLLLGDTLAVCLQKKRNFTARDFAKFHPGGALGKQLYTQVKDVLEPTDLTVNPGDTLSEVILQITSNRMGVAVVLQQKKLLGIITDGDLRRMLLRGLENLGGVTAKEIMSPNPKTIDANVLIQEALVIMRHNQITSLVVFSEGKYAGGIHMHQILNYET